MDFNARWAELSKSPSYPAKSKPARTATRPHVADQNTFALGEETQAALLEAEAALSSSDIYSDDEILGDPDISGEPRRGTVATKSERLSATSYAPALDTLDQSVVVQSVARNEAPNGNTTVARRSASGSNASESPGWPADRTDDISKSRTDGSLDGRDAKLLAIAESQATNFTCTPRGTNSGEDLENPHSSPPGAIPRSSPVISRSEYASLGRQIVEDSQDPLVNDMSSDELTLSQLMAGSLVNSSIPRPPQWSDSIEYK
jgi:hypothetical protein